MSLCFLQCYKSSKEQTPLLDVSLLGCSVVYKEKQLKRKEHKLKIVPVGAEAIVLALQSKEQTEQWLRVILPIHRLKDGSTSLRKPFDLSSVRSFRRSAPSQQKTASPSCRCSTLPGSFVQRCVSNRAELLPKPFGPGFSFCCCSPGRAEREALGGIRERQQH